ncbi:peptide subunit release factor 1 (eRF1) [Leuconostoc rapi]|nr:peptide subunit release factor 1 (eRF1) [Leuconostoc rapi]
MSKKLNQLVSSKEKLQKKLIRKNLLYANQNILKTLKLEKNVPVF